jgi:hypothetical protein
VQRLTGIAVAAGLLLIVTGVAGAVSPAVGLAKQLKGSMQSYYAKSDLKFTTVTCKIAANGSVANCQAHFTVAAKRAVGVFQVRVTQTASGTARTKTISVACKDSKTGAKVSCF